MANEPPTEWTADVKAADAAVLPEYTPLPTSPQGSPANSEVAPSDSASAVSYASDAGASPTCTEGLNIFKLLWTGFLAIVLPPGIIAMAALACAGVMIYGCGRILEAMGRGLSVGPEMIYRAYLGKRVQRVAGMVRGGQRQVPAQDVETGAIAI